MNFIQKYPFRIQKCLTSLLENSKSINSWNLGGMDLTWLFWDTICHVLLNKLSANTLDLGKRCLGAPHLKDYTACLSRQGWTYRTLTRYSKETFQNNHYACAFGSTTTSPTIEIIILLRNNRVLDSKAYICKSSWQVRTCAIYHYHFPISGFGPLDDFSQAVNLL